VITAEPYIASFVADGEVWAGAIYAMRPGLGPELVLRCGHNHPTMNRATACAVKQLAWARRISELAELYPDIEP
jgi:hypothetical protein